MHALRKGLQQYRNKRKKGKIDKLDWWKGGFKGE